MAGSIPVRKSGRQRVPNKKYTSDVFEGLDILSSDSEGDAVVIQQLIDDKDDEDFPQDQATPELEEEEEEDDIASRASDGSAIMTPIEEYEEAHSYATSDAGTKTCLGDLRPHGFPKPRARNGYSVRTEGTRSRGLPDNPSKPNGGPNRLQLLAGPATEDIMHILKSRDQWAADPTLPSRHKMRHPLSHTKERRQMEATVGWNWYYDQGGRERLAEKQKYRGLSSSEGSLYVPKPTQKGQELLMGPYGKQKLFTLSTSQSVRIDEAWSTASIATNDDNVGRQANFRPPRRHGWMLNVGARVRCVDWAPNHDGDVQYVALATAPLKKPRVTGLLKEAPAFLPSAPSPSCVQIWAFTASTGLEAESSPDLLSAPALAVVLCTTWGDVKQVKWCPMPRAARDEDSHGKIFLGLLAGIWADGYARVLDVQLDKNDGPATIYLKLDSAAFAARLPDTICTCLTWLSATDLAVGHANGLLAAYDICPPSVPSHYVKDPQISTKSTAISNLDVTVWSKTVVHNEHQDPTNSLQSHPWLHIRAHPSCMISLTSAYPANPSLLISSNLSGHTRLTSLRAPKTDYVLLPRSRSPPSTLVYCDALLGIVYAEEATETIRLAGLRCFYTSMAFCPISSNRDAGGVGSGCVDVGKLHTTVVWGGGDGAVKVGNPIRRILGRAGAGFHQTIFKHEWVSRPSPDTNAGERQGVSRITEGYKGELTNMGPKSKSAMSTIYEEETGVTALAWNPNLRCSGWLAVGWGSGLIRVEDVAV